MILRVHSALWRLLGAAIWLCAVDRRRAVVAAVLGDGHGARRARLGAELQLWGSGLGRLNLEAPTRGIDGRGSLPLPRRVKLSLGGVWP